MTPKSRTRASERPADARTSPTAPNASQALHGAPAPPRGGGEPHRAPRRVQRTRTKGWRKPAGAVIVDRTSRWGNPWRVVRDFRVSRDDFGLFVLDPDGHVWIEVVTEAEGRRIAADEYGRWVREPGQADLLAAARAELAGRDLCCPCPLPAEGEPDHCHAAVLLQITNAPAEVAS